MRCRLRGNLGRIWGLEDLGEEEVGGVEVDLVGRVDLAVWVAEEGLAVEVAVGWEEEDSVEGVGACSCKGRGEDFGLYDGSV